MLCVLGISLMIWGIVSISTGKMTLTAHKVVGPPAVYFLSIPMILALPINFAIGAFIGIQLAAVGGVLDDATQMKLSIMEGCITGGTFLIVLIAGAILGVDPNELQRSRRRRYADDYDDEDDEDDDRPRRRRHRDEDDDDDEDDAPRRRRRPIADDEDDDPPRRRPRRNEDDEGIAPGPPR